MHRATIVLVLQLEPVFFFDDWFFILPARRVVVHGLRVATALNTGSCRVYVLCLALMERLPRCSRRPAIRARLQNSEGRREGHQLTHGGAIGPQRQPPPVYCELLYT
jgi:hypothetical protein